VNLGSGPVTITPTTSIIDGVPAITLTQGMGLRIVSDGMNYQISDLRNPIVHGDPIWDTDPAVVKWIDDFMFGGAAGSASSLVTREVFGELGWDCVLGSSDTATKLNGTPPNMGVYQLNGAGLAANNGISLAWPGSGTSTAIQNIALPLLDYPGWEMNFVFKFTTNRLAGSASSFPIAHRSFYMGLCPPRGSGLYDPTASGARPPFFVGLRFDTSASGAGISDTTFHFETVANPDNTTVGRNNAQGTTFDTTITPSEDVWYRFSIKCTAAGAVVMTLAGNGVTTQSHTFSGISKLSCAGNVSTETFTLVRNNGLGEMSQTGNASATTSNFCWAAGSKVTITGAANGVFNSSWVLTPTGGGTIWTWPLAGASLTESNSGATITGYPGLVPFVNFWTDDGASGFTTMVFCWDYFSMIWNLGISNVGTIPDQTRSRYSGT
jgi:hypothetical protein